MQLTIWDGAVPGIYFALNLTIGAWFARRSGSGPGEFFLGGRSVPWWLAGTSMAAVSAAVDTPLAVTGVIYTEGIVGNWLWWSFALSGMLTVFCLAPLWRRAKVVTDMEFTELRYSGRPAAFLRGFRALYIGLPVNCLILGWVNLAMAKVLGLTMGLGKLQAVFACLAVTLLYSSMGGLWAVLWTDLVGFVLKTGMAVLLAYFAVRGVGGMDRLIARVQAADAIRGTHTLQFFPHAGQSFLLSFLVLLSLNWWSPWYPGAEPGGGGYVAQRIFSTKDEKQALGATLWFNVARYALQPWPWVVTALVAIVLLPTAGDTEGAYLLVLLRFLPRALRGLMLAALAAAYMSATAAHLNLSASYLVNDVYARFLVRGRGAKHYGNASRLATLLCALLSVVATLSMNSVAGAWRFLLAIGAGAGLVFILRWFWWRINAWSEIGAMTAAATISLTLQSSAGMTIVHALQRIDAGVPAVPLSTANPHGFAWLMLLTTGGTTLVWLTVTLLTRPEPTATLQAFYDRVRPPAAGWKPFAPDSALAQKTLRWNMLHWALGSALIYFALFGIGNLLFQRVADGLLMVVCSAACLTLLFRSVSKQNRHLSR